MRKIIKSKACSSCGRKPYATVEPVEKIAMSKDELCIHVRCECVETNPQIIRYTYSPNLYEIIHVINQAVEEWNDEQRALGVVGGMK